MNFLTLLLDDVLMLNMDKINIEEQKTKTKHFFSNELTILTLKAYYKLKARAAANLRKLFPGGRFNLDKEERDNKEREFEDEIVKFIFSTIFEDLILRLQNC